MHAPIFDAEATVFVPQTTEWYCATGPKRPDPHVAFEAYSSSNSPINVTSSCLQWLSDVPDALVENNRKALLQA